jgi:hypothetical protein
MQNNIIYTIKHVFIYLIKFLIFLKFLFTFNIIKGSLPSPSKIIELFLKIF